MHGVEEKKMTEQQWRRELHNFVQQLMLICESPDEREKVLKSWCERPVETVGERGVQVREVVRDALREEKEKVRNRLIYLLNSLFTLINYLLFPFFSSSFFMCLFSHLLSDFIL